MMQYYKTEFGCKWNSSLEYFAYLSPRCDLDTEDSEPTFSNVTSPHDTKFGKKWLGGSGDTEWTESDTQTELQTDSRTDKVIPII